LDTKTTKTAKATVGLQGRASWKGRPAAVEVGISCTRNLSALGAAPWWSWWSWCPKKSGPPT